MIFFPIKTFNGTFSNFKVVNIPTHNISRIPLVHFLLTIRPVYDIPNTVLFFLKKTHTHLCQLLCMAVTNYKFRIPRLFF